MKRLLETTIKMKEINPQEEEEAEDTDPLKSLAMLAATLNKADADADAESDEDSFYCPAGDHCPCGTLEVE